MTDVLVDRGSREVARTVAVNSGARFSQTGFATLVKRAEQDDVLAELAGQRADLPPQLFAQLLAKATQTVQAKLTASLRPEAAEDVTRTLNKLARELQAPCPVRDYTTALARMQLVQADGRLDESIVLESAKADQFEEVAAGLALLCSVSGEESPRDLDRWNTQPGADSARLAGLLLERFPVGWRRRHTSPTR